MCCFALNLIHRVTDPTLMIDLLFDLVQGAWPDVKSPGFSTTGGVVV